MHAYLKDKSNIYAFQNKQNVFITSKDTLKSLKIKPKGKVIIANKTDIQEVPLHIFGTHNIQNAAYAYSAARELGLPDHLIQKSFRSFTGLEGRLQLLGRIRGKYVINDNNATTPEATIAGIQAMGLVYKKKNIILIAGGSDKTLDLKHLAQIIRNNCKQVILLPGTGTEKLKLLLATPYTETKTLKAGIEEAFVQSKKDDVILFSPGFASFGLFTNEYDRNDQFVKIIKNIQKKK
jgi:UDP-N-acetylmuramoylalanine--D-glutamate ligase